jgi:hypothetical protein
LAETRHLYHQTAIFRLRIKHGNPNEKRFDPPLALPFAIRANLLYGEFSSDPVKAQKRRELIGSSQTRALEGLNLLRNNPHAEDWHLFEGKTQSRCVHPDTGPYN